jgi:hypothetical protein
MPGRIWKRSLNSHSDNWKFKIENRKLYGLAPGALCFWGLAFPSRRAANETPPDCSFIRRVVLFPLGLDRRIPAGTKGAWL